MGKLGYIVNPNGTMMRLLGTWNPKAEDRRRLQPSSEKEYERSLVEHLRNNLEGLQIIPQSGKGYTRGDIAIHRKAIGKEDIVELKMGLKNPAVCQRLIGQIEQYEPAKHGWVFIVICGPDEDTDPKLLIDLKTRYRGRECVAVFRKKPRRGVSRVV